MWEREQVTAALNANLLAKPVGFATRQLVEDLYGVDISAQIHIENMLKHKGDMTPLVLDVINYPASWIHYFDNYCRQSPVGDSNIVGMDVGLLNINPFKQYLDKPG